MLSAVFFAVAFLSVALCDEFVIKPHVNDNVRVVRTFGKDKYACDFRWKCTGGSSEDWNIDVVEIGDGRVECVIKAKHPQSYILFTEWEAVLKTPRNARIVQAAVSDQNGALAAGTAWQQQKRKLRSVAGWTGAVTRIVLTAGQDEKK